MRPRISIAGYVHPSVLRFRSSSATLSQKKKQQKLLFFATANVIAGILSLPNVSSHLYKRIFLSVGLAITHNFVQGFDFVKFVESRTLSINRS